MRHNPKSKRWRGICIDHLNDPPITLFRLNELIGEARGLGISAEKIKIVLGCMGYDELKGLPKQEWPRFAAFIQGQMAHAQAQNKIDDFVAFANGGPDPRKVARSSNPTAREENMAIEMTIRATFEHQHEWLDYLRSLSVLGFVKPGEHTHHAPVKAGEQKVNALDHDSAAAEPKARATRDKKEAKPEFTSEDVDAKIGEAKAAGVGLRELRKIISGLGYDGIAKVPPKDYGKLIALIDDAIKTSKAEL